MTDVAKLNAKAAKCGPVPNVPTAVLPQMVTAKLGSSDSFERLQGTVDYLTCLAKAGLPFSDDQKEFMHDLFEAFSTGGSLLGMPEAAKLADHYVNGNGARVQLPPYIYQSSVIVRDASAAMAAFIADRIDKQPTMALLSRDSNFRNSGYAKPLLRGTRGRSQLTQGVILPDGALMSEQTNTRLKNADHRFILEARASKQGTQSLRISWEINARYEFETFSQSAYWTDIPLGAGRVLKVPDGLSEYISRPDIGVAIVFDYGAQWQSIWPLRAVK